MARKVFMTATGDNQPLSRVAEKSPMAAFIWLAMYAHFDDWGRMDGRVRRIKADVFWSFDNVTNELIEESLALLESAGMVIRYEVQGAPFLAVPHAAWRKEQSHIKRIKWVAGGDAASDFPPPPGYIPLGKGEESDDSENNPAPGETLREKSRKSSASPSPSPSPSLSPTTTDNTSAVDTAQGALESVPSGRSSSSLVEMEIGGELLDLTPTIAQALKAREHWLAPLAESLAKAEARVPRGNRVRRSGYAKSIVTAWLEGDGTPPDPARIADTSPSESTLERERAHAAKVKQAPPPNALEIPHDWLPGVPDDDARPCVRQAIAELRSDERLKIPTAKAMLVPNLVTLIRDTTRAVWADANPEQPRPWEVPDASLLGRPSGPAPKKQLIPVEVVQ